MKKIVIATMLLLAGSAFSTTKQEILDSIAANPFYQLGTVKRVHIDTVGDIGWYQAHVLKTSADSSAANGQSIDFYVVNEGEVDEWASLKRALVTASTPDQFQPAIASYLVGQQIILKSIVTIDVVALWAECAVWVWDSPTSTFSEQMVLVRKVSGSLTHNNIVAP